MYIGGLELFGDKEFLFQTVISCKKSFIRIQISIYSPKILEYDKLKANRITLCFVLRKNVL